MLQALSTTVIYPSRPLQAPVSMEAEQESTLTCLPPPHSRVHEDQSDQRSSTFLFHPRFVDRDGTELHLFSATQYLSSAMMRSPSLEL